MRVEEPRSGGGTSTTGNVARRAFDNPKLLAEILELDEQMVENLSLLLSALSMHHSINIDEFGKLCDETHSIYVSKYKNIAMNVSLHKLLVHGVDILKLSILPPGYMSEEAAEAKNKYFRLDRQFHARRVSRVANLTDVYKRSMAMSDPKISSLGLEERMKKKKKKIPISPELRKLILLEEIATTEEVDNNESGVEMIGDSDESEDETEEDDEDDLVFYFDNNNYWLAQELL